MKNVDIKNGDVEYGKCPTCNTEGPLERRYYHYDIKCECHSPDHFEIVWYCKNCSPKEPEFTRIHLHTAKLRRLTKQGIIIQNRRCGNTTRQVDAAVQELFTEGKVIWKDHAHTFNNMAQDHGFKRLLDRLRYEHRYAFPLMTINSIEFMITLKSEEG